MHHLIVIVGFLIVVDYHQLHVDLEAAVAAQIQLRFLELQARLEEIRQRAVETQTDAAGGQIVDPQLIRRAVRVFAGTEELAPVRCGDAELAAALDVDQLLRQPGRAGLDALMFGQLRLADGKLDFGVVAFNHDGAGAVDGVFRFLTAKHDIVRPDAQ